MGCLNRPCQYFYTFLFLTYKKLNVIDGKAANLSNIIKSLKIITAKMEFKKQ